MAIAKGASGCSKTMSIRDLPVLSIFSLATAALAGFFCRPEWKPDQRRWHTDRDDNDHRDYDHQHRGDNRNCDLTRH
jgi:hypothetical protein